MSELNRGEGMLLDASTPGASTVELAVALENTLSLYLGAPQRIVRLGRRASEYRSSFAIEELDVQLDDGAVLSLMFKDLSWQSLLEEARRGKPAFLYDPRREIETYQTILKPTLPSTPICYGAAVDPRAGRYWLFLEKVPGVELYQIGDFAIWQQAAHWLAATHTRYAPLKGHGNRPRLTETQAAHLLRYDADFYWRWLRRAQAFLRQDRVIEWLAERYDRIVELLVELPVTFIHGEFYASNVLVQETAGQLRICPIDWEMAAVGPGLLDLAALTSGKWTDAEAEALALAYYAALPPDGGWPHGKPEAFLKALDCCRLHLAVQWLGWSSEWSPPAAHAQDWLGEAVRLAEKLGLGRCS